MAWFKVDDGFYTSHKVLSIPREARLSAIGAWIMVGTWSADKMTDGKVPVYVLRDFGVEFETMMHLIDAGLWISNEDDDYITFHDWCEYQPTREQLEAKSRKRSEAGSMGGVKSGESRRSKSEANTKQNEANPKPEPEPEPEPLTSSCSSDDEPKPSKSPYTNEFEQFWIAYPRKQAKGKAFTAFQRLKKTKAYPGLDVLISAAERYAYDTRLEPQFQKLCEGWLNAHRWLDEPLMKPVSLEPPKKQFGVRTDEDV